MADDITGNAERRWHYAAIFRESGAVLFNPDGFSFSSDDQNKRFVGYNVYLKDRYAAMLADPELTPEIKGVVKGQIGPLQRLKHLFDGLTADSLEGWHVIRTEEPLKPEQREKFREAVQTALNRSIYLKSEGRTGVLKEELVSDQLYPPFP